MTKIIGDPIGQAILDYSKSKKPADILVHSDLCDDDIIPIEVLFRTYQEMPQLEKEALTICKGKILDVGSGAGVHASWLVSKGFQTDLLEPSLGAFEFLKAKKFNVYRQHFQDFDTEVKYDTILMLMNGIGIAGTFSNLIPFFKKVKSLLNPGGQLIFDSSDVSYLYEDEDGSILYDLNSAYYGNFKFSMEYKSEVGEWFDWLYVDYDSVHAIAKELGAKSEKIIEIDNHYLARIIFD